jgi:carotenoid cleavage dioxygenase
MPRPAPELLTGNYAPVPDETTLADLTVVGTLPTVLSGQYVRIGPNPVRTTVTPCDWGALDGMVHAVALHAGRAVGYRNRWVTTDAVARTLGADPVPGPAATEDDVVATNVIAFGGRILALGSRSLAYELDHRLVTVGRVDLAGAGRGIGAHPQVDPLTGALHLVSHGDEPSHHTVSARSQTRISVPVPDAPRALDRILLTGDRFVLLGEGVAGVTNRVGPHRPRWIDLELSGAVDAWDAGCAVAVLVAGDDLRTATLDPAGNSRHEVLDDAPQRFGLVNPRVVGQGARYVWAVAADGGTEVFRHDLRTGERARHDLGAGRQPGALSFVADPARRHREDGGWLIGLVHDERTNEADLIVLDAAAIDRPPVATVHIPRRIPYGLHGAWIPGRLPT